MQIPKPDARLVTPCKKTIYVEPGEHIQLAEEPHWLLLADRPYGENSSLFALESLRALIAFGDIGIDAAVIPALLSNQIPIIFFSGEGEHTGRLEPATTPKSSLLRAIVELEEDRRSHLAKMIVWGSLRQHRRFLLRSGRKKAQTFELATAIEKIEWAIEAATKKELTQSITGCLGSGLSAYYQFFPNLIRVPGWDWEGREAATPLNAMLNYTYRLVEQAIITALCCYGLDLHTGIWRKARDRTPYGLVHDLATEFKVFGEAIVLRTINRNQIALKDFDNWEPSQQKIPLRVRQLLTAEYQTKMSDIFRMLYTELRISYQEMMAFQCKQLAEYLSQNINNFCPVSVK